MRKETIFLVCLSLFVACSDEMEDADRIVEENIVTRSVDKECDNYYWFFEEKIPADIVPAKSFVLFDANDEELVLKSLPISKDKESYKIHDYAYNGTDMSGKFAKKFLNCKWAEVDMNAEDADNFSFVKYAAPYHYGIDDASMPLTNIINVSLKSDDDIKILQKCADEYGVGLIGKYLGLPHLYLLACDKGSSGDALQVANWLHETGNFEWAQPAFISLTLDSNDAYFSNQWNLSTSNAYSINYNSALSLIPSTSNVVVGVVDSGIQLNHPDLNLTSASFDVFQNSIPSVIYGNNAHGTNVAGVISAKTGNSIGIAGIAPCVKSLSISVDIQSSNAHMPADVAKGIRMAVDHGASVINCSWHVDYFDSSIDSAIRDAIENGRNGKGCILVASSGNSNTGTLKYPANHSVDDEVIAVGAINSSGTRYSSSNYGSNLDLVAPGVNIPTTTLNSGYTTSFTGTSAAAPHVSAAAALMLTLNPNLTYKEVGLILNLTAKKNLPGYSFSSSSWGGTRNNQVGHGLLNLGAALNYVSTTTSPHAPVTMSGPYTITTDMSGNARTTLSVTPNSSNYTYVWSSSFTGSYDRWYIWPSDNGYGSSCEVSAYLYNGQSGGTLQVNCKVYGPSGYIGETFRQINVQPGY